jgi:hypothetical protein
VDFCLAAFSGATKVTYAWQANGTTIAGATSVSYRIPASLLHKTLTCSVTASNAKGSVSGTSKGAVVGGGWRHPIPRPHHSQGSGRHDAVSASGPGWPSDALSALRDLAGLGV